MKKTYVYVDGFNLYYGAVKGTPFKWLDISKLCGFYLPPAQNQILKIKYFTARIKARPNDQDKPTRQQIFLRALRTIPHLEIIYGRFLSHKVSMPVANCSPQKQRYELVIKTEEKGSDVNIASHLINDGHKGEYEAAVLITNDTDLLEPIKIVRRELNLVVGILNPQKRQNRLLAQAATFNKSIRAGALENSQFLDTLTDASGTFHKPKNW